MWCFLFCQMGLWWRVHIPAMVAWGCSGLTGAGLVLWIDARNLKTKPTAELSGNIWFAEMTVLRGECLASEGAASPGQVVWPWHWVKLGDRRRKVSGADKPISWGKELPKLCCSEVTCRLRFLVMLCKRPTLRGSVWPRITWGEARKLITYL